MDQGSGGYASQKLEDQLRDMIMSNRTSQQHSDPRILAQSSNVAHGYPSRVPPGFGGPPAQPRYSNNIPMDRQQDFSHFLQQHHATAPVPVQPRPALPQIHNNNLRAQGPHRNYNLPPMDPNTFDRPPHQAQRSHQPYSQHRPHQNQHHHQQHQHQQRQLYQPQSRPQQTNNPYLERQASFLDSLANQEISKTQMLDSEVELKDAFRLKLQRIFENLKSPDPGNPLPSVELASFGSLSSGFATAGSDMDLAIVTSSEHDLSQRFSSHENGLPRVLEKELLDNGIGARLLTRTRVPIIKICELPSPELLDALRESREKWDNLPEDEKYATSKPSANDTATEKDAPDTQFSPSQPGSKIGGSEHTAQSDVDSHAEQSADGVASLVESTQALELDSKASSSPAGVTSKSENTQQPDQQQPQDKQTNRQRNERSWRREKAAGPLDFPKDGVGIQCDINFFNPLGIHNTQMLRCYSKCDPRVRPMVLFIKSWAKRRKINSSYSGTLSSYGYVLMVLHYLVNVANPPVLPNLQHEAEANGLPPATIDGYEVRFFDKEDMIESRASQGLITQNKESLGNLLVGFFRYYAVNAGGFFWTRDVLSLRSRGGIVSKLEKGWTGAKTEVGDNKEVRHRYLFAIEDPFETTHNVARTVTHNGIVAIRDEFRRAWRIIGAIGRNREEPEGGLFDELTEAEEQGPVSTAPPPTVNKVQAYSQQFPSLAGGSANATAAHKPHSPVHTPAQPVQAAQPATQALAQEAAPSSQAEVAPPAPRGKGRRQKFVPFNL